MLLWNIFSPGNSVAGSLGYVFSNTLNLHNKSGTHSVEIIESVTQRLNFDEDIQNEENNGTKNC